MAGKDFDTKVIAGTPYPYPYPYPCSIKSPERILGLIFPNVINRTRNF